MHSLYKRSESAAAFHSKSQTANYTTNVEDVLFHVLMFLSKYRAYFFNLFFQNTVFNSCVIPRVLVLHWTAGVCSIRAASAASWGVGCRGNWGLQSRRVRAWGNVSLQQYLLIIVTSLYLTTDTDILVIFRVTFSVNSFTWSTAFCSLFYESCVIVFFKFVYTSTNRFRLNETKLDITSWMASCIEKKRC